MPAGIGKAFEKGSCWSWHLLFHKGYRITHPDGSTGKNFCKHPFFGHDAVSGAVKNGTFFVAFFTDLGDFHKGFLPQPHLLSDFLGFPVNAGGGDIFGKIPELQNKRFGADSINAFSRQKTDLPVPASGMGIPFDAMVFNQFCLVNALLGGAFFFAHGNGNYFHGASFLYFFQYRQALYHIVAVNFNTKYPPVRQRRQVIFLLVCSGIVR
jgi:hypothetical protein